MTEREQFLETIQKILKPKEPSKLSPRGISAKEMSRKLHAFQDELKVKEQKINEMAAGYINTRSLSEEEITNLKIEINSMFNDYIKSFNK